MTVAEAAQRWQETGVAPIPIEPDGKKSPHQSWAEYQTRLPSRAEVDRWWAPGSRFGLALIMGRVSGNTEMTEVEGRAMDAAHMARIQESLRRHDATEIWDLLTGPYGYSEMSPNGGIHLIYHISDHEVPGNTKIATRPPTAEELADKPKIKVVVLAETRGEGGYVIVAPTPGTCHPSGEGWTLLTGRYGALPTLTWAARCRLHAALREALHEEPPAPPAPSRALVPRQRPPAAIEGLSPGDDFEARTDWEDALLLGGAGWTKVAAGRDGSATWTRAGKDPRDGISATTGRAADRDRLYVFSTSTEFPSEESITKFRAFSLLHHGGDDSQAAKHLVRLGFGSRTPSTQVFAELEDFIPQQNIEPEPYFTHDEVGNAERLWHKVRGEVHWVHEFKSYYRWDGRVWGEDYNGSLTRTWTKLTEAMLRSADEDEAKWGKRSRSRATITATLSLLRDVEGVTTRAAAFDTHRHLLNVANGVLDLDTGEFTAHRRELMMTRMFGAAYDPQAACPQFERFMEQVLPDPQVRAYVQRAVGATLLGDADQRAIFMIHGPTGTGKSQFTETLRHVFGDYGQTAPASTFRAKRDLAGPSNDLHRLRGSRFVSTSETAEGAQFDEDLLKRISGTDTIQSRTLYQDYIEWTPELSLWIATNHPPRFSNDDDAVWRRIKLIPFLTQFGTDQPAVPDFARTRLFPEASGILNWMLAGLQAFCKYGLAEPVTVTEAAAEQRQQGDSVARFLEERIADGILVCGEHHSIRTAELHAMYLEWSRQNNERGLARRRFSNRMEYQRSFERIKTNGQLVYRGLGRAPHAGMLGLIPPPNG